MSERGLENLETWRAARDFALSIYKMALPCLPDEEKWGLSNQLRRASQSIPANIAEGYGRYHFLESIRFCYIARGSLEETYSHLVLAHELDYLPTDIFQQLSGEYRSLLRLINGYIAYLRKSRKGEDELNSRVIKEELIHPSPSDWEGEESET